MKFLNLFEAYNEHENFRVLICADDQDEAQEIADEYCRESGLEGAFEVYYGYSRSNEAHYDCDYVLTKN